MAIKIGQGAKNFSAAAGAAVPGTAGAAVAAERAQKGDLAGTVRASSSGMEGLKETSLAKKYFSGPKAHKTTNSVTNPEALNTAAIDVRNINTNDPRLTMQAANVGAFNPMERTTIGAIDPMQAAQIQAGGNFQQAMGAQSGLMEQLQAQSMGQGPSIADMQMQKGMEANLAATRASLASARGGTNPLMARQTMQTSADIQAKTAQDSAMARLQEQMAAQQQLATVAGQARVQSFEEASQQAQMQQQANLANMQTNLQRAIAQGQITASEAGQMYQAEVQRAMQNAQMQQQASMQNSNNFIQAMGMGINRDLGVSGQMMGAQQFDINALMQAQGQQNSVNQFNAQARAQAAAQEQARNMAILNAGAQVGAAYVGGPAMAGTAAAANPAADRGMDPNAYQTVNNQHGTYQAPMNANTGQQVAGPWQPVTSDENLKTEVRDASKDVKSFLDTMGAYNYKYTDEKHGKGRFVSPMAQEMEKSDWGKSLVVDTAEGKKVDYQRGYGFLMAAASYLNRRLDDVEKKGKK